MTKWKLKYFVFALSGVMGAFLLNGVYVAYETGHSASRGYNLLFPVFCSPIIISLLIFLSVTLKRRWKDLTIGERIFGLAGAIPLALTFLRFFPHIFK